MTTTRTIARAAVLVLAVPALLLAGASGASADTSPRVHHATFQGPMSADGNSGVAGDDPLTAGNPEPGWCVDILHRSCHIQWRLDGALSVCDAQPSMGYVGTVEYMTAQQTVEARLQAVWGAGAGVLEGRFGVQDPSSNTPMIGVVHIDASDTCAALAAAGAGAAIRLSMDLHPVAVARFREFTGYVDYA
jgi:hypothetical protein